MQTTGKEAFATRFCEVESNLKVIQSVMGHKNIETTMNIYAEKTDRKKEETLENLELSFFRTPFLFIHWGV